MKFNAERFAELCIARGADPAEAALKILELESDDLPARARLDANIKLMEFLYPKQRAIEHSGTIGLTLPELLEQADEQFRNRPAS